MPELTRKELQQEIFEQASMRAIVESYGIQIQRNNTFICPFHNDTKPSMSIAKNDKYCKCFACGESGNVYTFIEKYEQQVNHRSLAPKEIFKMMAEKSNLNVDLTILDKENSDTSISPQQQRRKDLYNSINYTNNIYQYLLNTESGKIAKDYLIKRNINEDIQKQFGIGYVRRGLTSQMIDKTPDTTIDKLEAINIISRDENGNVREVFRNRIVIPIRNDTGQVVAFGGRIINSNEKAPKYLNSKETEIFHKSNILFNYNYARNYAINGEIFVVEGYMDVIGANVLGYKNSVALMGVEMSEQHIDKIKRINSNVVLALDNDASGKKAIIKTIPKLAQKNINVSVLDISKIQNGIYKDFGDLSENNVSKDEIENSRMSSFEYYFDNKYFNEKYDVDTIKNAFDSERKIMIRDTKDVIKYQQYIQSRTSFTKDEIQDIINPRKIDDQNKNLEVLPPKASSRMETFKNLLFMNNLDMQIYDFLENYNDSVLTDYYNSNKTELYNQMLENITNNPDRYIDETGTALNVALAIREVTENNVDYHRYETINRFGHEKAFDSRYVLNTETQQRERIKLNEVQKEMIVKQYDSTIDEQAKIDLKNVDKSLNIDSKNYVRSNNQPTNDNEEKWVPTPEQLEKYKKQVEETKELSKTAIRDIFDNYKTDPDKMIEYLQFSSRFYNYSPGNTAMIFKQNPHATFVQSSASWVKIGAYPKKGTHGASILVPQTKKFIIADKDTVLKYQKFTDNYRDTILSTNAQYVAVALSEACAEIKEKAKAGEYDIKEKLVFGKGTVFDISQTTYPKEKYPEIFSIGIADEKANFMCRAIANYINEKTPYSIEDVELDSISLGGYFSPSSNSICINTICEDTKKIYVMLHELGHAFYHNLDAQKSEKEVAQNTNTLFTTERKEIEADIFATMSLGMYGFELDDQLKSHLKGNYNSYIKQLENAGKSSEDISLDIENLSTNVMMKFNSHAKDMTQYIEEYTKEYEQSIEDEIEEVNETEETDEIEISF